jgi:hypothetical protein
MKPVNFQGWRTLRRSHPPYFPRAWSWGPGQVPLHVIVVDFPHSPPRTLSITLPCVPARGPTTIGIGPNSTPVVASFIFRSFSYTLRQAHLKVSLLSLGALCSDVWRPRRGATCATPRSVPLSSPSFLPPSTSQRYYHLLCSSEYYPNSMTREIPTPLDRADNPYMPRHLQDVPLEHDPDEFSVPHSFPFANTGLIDSGHPSAVSIPNALHDDTDVYLDNIDDNSSESLDSIEDHEFPSFFTQLGSPPRLFHSHGTYSLPVDGDEMKVCITNFWVV